MPATKKKLAGAPKTSLMKKRETVTRAMWEAVSMEKNLAWAVEKSFEKQCSKDAVG